MKFANYKFSARNLNSLGDNIQIIAIDNIYQSIGICEKDVVYIDTNDLESYDGEYVILPVTMPLVDYRSNGVAGRFSDRIIPVFIGFTIVKETLYPEEVDYLRRYEPIGCRDERTLQTMRRYRIRAYLHGCITATLPLRQVDDKNFDKVYIIDAPDGIEKYIPDELLEKAVYLTHLHEVVDGSPKEMANKYYQQYKDNAKLVITSLLHCSVPCMAAGIPVVLVKSAVSYRFGWLEKLLPIYEPDEFDKIDWYPKPVSYEVQKKAILELTINRLRDAFETNDKILDVSYFYENRTAKKYIVDSTLVLIDYLNSHWEDRSGRYVYSIWGMTQIAEFIVNYVEDNYPNAKLSHVYDTFRQETFFGLQSENPELIYNNIDETVLVTAIGAAKSAHELFTRICKRENTYAIVEVLY